MERLKFYLRSCADPTHGYIEDLDKLEAEVARLTAENAKLKREVDIAEKQSLDFYVEKENAAERQLKLISDQVQKNELLEAERDAMREQLDAIDKYLDIGTSDTSIHQNSVMHREVKALLGPY